MYADLFFLRNLATELWLFVTLSFLGSSLDEQCASLSWETQALYPAWTQQSQEESSLTNPVLQKTTSSKIMQKKSALLPSHGLDAEGNIDDFKRGLTECPQSPAGGTWVRHPPQNIQLTLYCIHRKKGETVKKCDQKGYFHAFSQHIWKAQGSALANM